MIYTVVETLPARLNPFVLGVRNQQPTDRAESPPESVQGHTKTRGRAETRNKGHLEVEAPVKNV